MVCVTVTFQRAYEVGKPQPSTASVYSYYEPGKGHWHSLCSNTWSLKLGKTTSFYKPSALETAPVVSRVHAHGRTDNEDILERFSCELGNGFHYLFYQTVVLKNQNSFWRLRVPKMEKATCDCPTVSKVAFGVENYFSVSNSNASRFR